LLGRVLRMPYATRRKAAVLNKAFANLVSKSFAEAADALRDRMVAKMGFGEQEAAANIELQSHLAGDDSGGLWGERRRSLPSTRVAVTVDAAAVAAVRAAPPERVSVAVREAVAKFEAEHLHTASPAEQGKPFVVPRLMAWVQGELALADSEILADHSPQLDEAAFRVTQTADSFEIDLDSEALMLRHTDTSDQLLLDVPVDGWSEAGLVQLLDRMVRDRFIAQGELVAWLSDVMRHLTGPRAILLATLMRCRFVLARKLKDTIAAIRHAERARAYQACLFAADAKPELSLENGFRFFDGMFDGVPSYRGKYQFSKHYLGWDRVAAFDGKGVYVMAQVSLDGMDVRAQLRAALE
jgi:type III restriction enzyme